MKKKVDRSHNMHYISSHESPLRAIATPLKKMKMENMDKHTQLEILLLALEAAHLRLHQARFAYDRVSNANTIRALADAEKLVARLESLLPF